MLGENESLEAGVIEAHGLMSQLGIEQRQLIEEAYVELLLEEGRQPPSSGRSKDRPAPFGLPLV